MSLVEDLMREMQDLQAANKELQRKMSELISEVSTFVIIWLLLHLLLPLLLCHLATTCSFYYSNIVTHVYAVAIIYFSINILIMFIEWLSL